MNLGDTTQSAIVTGASRGLGRLFAVELAALGFDVTIVARSAGGLDATAALIDEQDVACEVVVGDAADDEVAAATVARTIERFGAVGMLVNNAGIVHPAAVADQSIEDWWHVVQVNLRAPVRWVMAVLPDMRRRRSGRIINVSSPSAIHEPLAFYSSYTASKAGLSQFTAAFADEVAPDGLVAVAIGPVADTDMSRSLYDGNEVLPAATRDGLRAAFTQHADGLLAATTALFRSVARGDADHLSGSYLGFRGGGLCDSPAHIAARPATAAGRIIRHQS